MDKNDKKLVEEVIIDVTPRVLDDEHVCFDDCPVGELVAKAVLKRIKAIEKSKSKEMP